jgi:predicted dehydrogenase
MNVPRFVVIGLGGYGLVHIDALTWLEGQGRARLTGVVALEVDRKARPDRVASLTQRGVRLYDTLEDVMADGTRVADVLTVPIGIHRHVPVSVAALEAGMHVYCEKPVAGTIQEVDTLLAAVRRTGKQVAIGFQHMHSNSMTLLKERIVSGRLGAVRQLALMCGWPRSIQYFTRNEWTGRLRVGDAWILDSPANNAHAHYLMNALYLADIRHGFAATPARVRAELYRTNAIESADTVQLRIDTREGGRLHVLLTHANETPYGPVMCLDCERGKAYWQTDDGITIVLYADGSHESFDNRTHPFWRYDAFSNMVDSLVGKAKLTCPPELARMQTLAVNLMHESCPEITPVSEEFVRSVEDWEMFPPNTRGQFRRVAELDQHFFVAFSEGAFLSELGVPWARGTVSDWVAGDGLTRFPGERFQTRT